MTVSNHHLPSTHLPRTPTLTIVIVHFNTAQITGHCVATLLKVLDPSPLKGLFEIVVIDNARATRDFATADERREYLASHGVSVSNTKFGSVWSYE